MKKSNYIKMDEYHYYNLLLLNSGTISLCIAQSIFCKLYYICVLTLGTFNSLLASMRFAFFPAFEGFI